MRKPTRTQLNLLLTAVRNGGYLPATGLSGGWERTAASCRRRGWMQTDLRIIGAGRDAAAAADPARYRDATLTLTAYRIPGPTGAPAPAHIIPDHMIQYEVPAGRAADFVGYLMLHRGELHTIVRAEVPTIGYLAGSCVLSVPDEKGRPVFAGRFDTEFCAYGEPGGPDRKGLAAVLCRHRQHDPFAARVRNARIAAFDAGIVLGLAEARQLVLDEDHDAAITDEQARNAERARGFIMGQTGNGKTNWLGTVIEQVRAAGYEIVEVQDEVALVLEDIAYRTGKVRATMDQIMRMGRHEQVFLIDLEGGYRLQPQRANFADLHPSYKFPRQEIRMALVDNGIDYLMFNALNVAEQNALDHGVPLAVYRRLSPGVHSDALDANLPTVLLIQDALAALLPDELDFRMVQVDPRNPGYRVYLFTARRRAADKQARRALLFLELAMAAFAAGRWDGERMLAKATVALGI